MPGSKTAYLSQKLLDHALGGAAYTPPGTVYLALSSAAFSSTATGSALTELAATGAYARVALTNDATHWTAATAAAPSIKSNVLDIVWPTATADWTMPLSVYVCDAATAGNALYGADLTSPGAVALGDTFKVLAGTFVFSED